MSDIYDFRKLEFTSPANVTRTWLEAFSEQFGREHFKLHMEPSRDAPFHLRGVNRALPDFSVYHGRSSPVRSRSVEPTENDDPVITVALQGRFALEIDGERIELSPGMMIPLRNGVAGEFATLTDAEFVTIRLSNRLLAPLVPGLRDIRHLPGSADNDALRLLVGYLRMIATENESVAPDLRHLVTLHVHDLAAHVFRSIRDSQRLPDAGGVRAGRLAAVKSDILAHLDDPDLSARKIASRQGLTARYIHILFEQDDMTFSEYVIAQRLARAHRMLADPTSSRTISAIAMEVGFGDLSYFNRTFRRRFGASPSELRETMRRGTP